MLLSANKHFWPNAIENLHAGRKLDVMQSISRCVVDVARAHPEQSYMTGAVLDTLVLADPPGLVHAMLVNNRPSSLVIKRELSDGASHTIHPTFHVGEHTGSTNPRDILLSQFCSIYRTSVDHCEGLPRKYHPRWFCQPFIEAFNQHGELRLHFIGMQLEQLTMTSWKENNPSDDGGEMYAENITQVTPLDRLRWVYFSFF